MEIATNAVLAALLIQASAFVKDIGIPLETPLQADKVSAFNLRVTSGSDGQPELACYLAYDRGYEFRHNHGDILSFNTVDSYSRAGNRRGLTRLLGQPRYSEAECLTKARAAIRSLGYTNTALLNDLPKVVTSSFTDGVRVIPRYTFQWLYKGPIKFAMQMIDAEIEVNSERLTIESLTLISQEFWREPWPITLGTTNVYEVPDPTAPTRADLEVRDVSRDYASAFIRAILPQVSEFCAKLGPPIPSNIEESDIVMGGSYVAVKRGRLAVSLRLKSGYLIVFHAGHVWAVHAKDAWINGPAARKEFRTTQEYTAPTQLSKEEASRKVHQILVERLGLPEKPLFLDHEPVYAVAGDLTQTNSLRRYVFHWQPPETEEQRDQRRIDRIPPAATVSAEVDAVSGEIKAINFFDKSFERSDPKIEIEDKVSPK